MFPTNPFTPEFGSVPLVMAGRQSIRRELFDAFSQGRGNPNLSSILIGPRGSGKTALLTYLAKEASSEGWVAVHAVAMPGMLEDIFEQTRLACANALEKKEAYTPPQLTSLGLGPVSVGWAASPAPSENWRTRMSGLMEALEGAGLGLLITVDEVVASLDEMVRLAAVYQLFVREQRRVAPVMAGLPSNISALLNDKSVSFFAQGPAAQARYHSRSRCQGGLPGDGRNRRQGRRKQRPGDLRQRNRRISLHAPTCGIQMLAGLKSKRSHFG